jgi:hypothetical protein
LPALHQLQKHIQNFKSLPEFVGTVTLGFESVTIPGLSQLGHIAGGGSFEYWAWVSKQYVSHTFSINFVLLTHEILDSVYSESL